LIAAARTGDLRVVRFLVESGADPNMWIDSDGYASPLGVAVYEGYEEVCKYLIPLVVDEEEIEFARRELPRRVAGRKRRENL
jgi:Ankyrin repeats (many copies)